MAESKEEQAPVPVEDRTIDADGRLQEVGKSISEIAKQASANVDSLTSLYSDLKPKDSESAQAYIFRIGDAQHKLRSAIERSEWIIQEVKKALYHAREKAGIHRSPSPEDKAGSD